MEFLYPEEAIEKLKAKGSAFITLMDFKLLSEACIDLLVILNLRLKISVCKLVKFWH